LSSIVYCRPGRRRMVSVSTASKFASHPKVIKNRRLGWFTRGQERISKPADYGRESFRPVQAIPGSMAI
jgi:hypothetical protein